jgi:hypothetical protein
VPAVRVDQLSAAELDVTLAAARSPKPEARINQQFATVRPTTMSYVLKSATAGSPSSYGGSGRYWMSSWYLHRAAAVERDRVPGVGDVLRVALPAPARRVYNSI